MKGFFNRILRIDLARRRSTYEPLPDELLARTLGGKGLAVHLLLDESPRGADALAADSPFIIATGPVTGTKLWGQSRFGVFAKSPATGGFGESYCGGTLAPKIKGCGFDAMVITGRSEKPVYLRVDGEGVSFEDATPIWGMETPEAEERVASNTVNGTGIMTIGPAGENLVRLACIKADRWRSLGRGGMGAVLGSKNLKAIAFSGTAAPQVANEKLLKEVIRTTAGKGKDSPITDNYRRNGTPSMVALTNAANCFPSRYWTSGHSPHWESLSADYMRTNFDVEAVGCPPCFLRCTNRCTLRNGRHAGLHLEGPEYETIYAFGGLNAVETLEEVAWLNDLCDRLGLDTISSGNIAAFVTYAAGLGKVQYDIEFGRPDRIAELLRAIAARDGIGNTLAEGIAAAERELGLAGRAIHVKGLEPAGFDPRVLKGMGLSYATSARGACHLRGTFYKAELTGEIDPATTSGKAELLIDYEDRAALFDCLILCRFYRDFYLWDELLTIVRATTGQAMDRTALQSIANRITQQTRAYNRREGVGPSADRLPDRMLAKATLQGARITAEELSYMLKEYNTLRESRYEA